MTKKLDDTILPGMESTITVTGRELAEWLCVTPAAVSQWHKAGKLQPIQGGAVPVFPLKASVQAMVKEWRAKRVGRSQGGNDLDRNLKYWQVEKAKQAVIQWRLTFGKDIAMAILTRLESALADFQKEVGAADPKVNAAALRLAGALRDQRYTEDFGLEGDDLEDGQYDDGAPEA